MDDDYLPLSAVFRFAHCPRQAYLFHVEDQHADNRFTVEGDIVHERVHNAEDESRPGCRICRGLWLVSHRLKVRGIGDVVEFTPNGPRPVEYKRGGKKGRLDEGAQLCLQALCLEEMLSVTIPEGFIWHDATRRRELVAFTPELRNEVETLVAEVHACLAQTSAPSGNRGKHCRSCSLEGVCLPRALDQKSAQTWVSRRMGKHSNLLDLEGSGVGCWQNDHTAKMREEWKE